MIRLTDDPKSIFKTITSSTNAQNVLWVTSGNERFDEIINSDYEEHVKGLNENVNKLKFQFYSVDTELEENSENWHKSKWHICDFAKENGGTLVIDNSPIISGIYGKLIDEVLKVAKDDFDIIIATNLINNN